MANKLYLDVAKTKCMVFGQNKYEHFDVLIDNSSIEQVNSIKFLGVIIDRNLEQSYTFSNYKGF